FVGEYTDGIVATVTLKNTTDKDRGYVGVPQAVQRQVLVADITDPDGQLMRRIGEPGVAEDFKALTPLGAGKEAKLSVGLGSYHFVNFRKAGKHTLQMTYNSPDGRVTSNAIAFTVYDPAKDDIVARQVLPIVGMEARRPAAERASAFLDQVRVGEKTYLVYRRYVGPKGGGGWGLAARLRGGARQGQVRTTDRAG